jgi:GNAT superfamily N-acetyltransferase
MFIMTRERAQVFRRGLPEEAAYLHELTGRSCLSWGYEPAFLDWEPEAIAVTPEFIERSIVWLLEEEGRVLGYYALTGDPGGMSLDKLFVEPDRIGTGCGKRLWRHAMETALAMGASELTLASDPSAAPFYRAMGAVWESEEQTSRPGWNLQFFRVTLTPQD